MQGLYTFIIQTSQSPFALLPLLQLWRKFRCQLQISTINRIKSFSGPMTNFAPGREDLHITCIQILTMHSPLHRLAQIVHTFAECTRMYRHFVNKGKQNRLMSVS